MPKKIDFECPDKIIVSGNRSLCGSVNISGDKVAAVHLLLATLLFDGQTTIKNLPLCADVFNILNWIKSNRYADVRLVKNILKITPRPSQTKDGLDLTGIANARNNICLISPSALKYEKAIFKGVGGCNFTRRKIDLHQKLIKSLGITMARQNSSCLVFKTKLPAKVSFNCASEKYGSSVGATCHALMAGMLLDQKMELTNSAQEPVVKVLIQYAKMAFGKKIVIRGKTIKISQRKKALPPNGVAINLPPDYTAAFTYILAMAVSGGKITLRGINDLPESVRVLLKKMNIRCKTGKNYLQAGADPKTVLSPGKVVCDVWPKFLSDMGPVLAAAATKCKGKTTIVDKIYDRRRAHVKGLNKMGYRLKARGNRVSVVGGDGPKDGKKIEVKARDIRSGAALLIGALGRRGGTVLTNCYQIFRGYENIVDNLNGLGANIKFYD